jgi:hypothetical protein
MRKLVFWSRLIDFLSLFLIIYGLAMVFAPQMMNTAFVGALLYNHNEVLRSAFIAQAEASSSFLNVFSGLLGSIVMGYALLIGWIAFEPFRRGERWAWNALSMSVSAWAAFEFYLKWSNGLGGLGLFAHFGLWIAFAVPLLATYRDFHPLPVNDTQFQV